MTAETRSRALAVPLALGTAAVLGLAGWLEPSPLGYSTHTQLGLGQCTFLELTAFPCPMCGMTTTFSLMAHFRPIGALLNQPFGVVLFLMTVATFAVSAAELVHPRARWVRFARWVEPHEPRLGMLFLAAMGAGWLYKIAVMRELWAISG